MRLGNIKEFSDGFIAQQSHHINDFLIKAHEYRYARHVITPVEDQSSFSLTSHRLVWLKCLTVIKSGPQLILEPQSHTNISSKQTFY